MKVIDLYNKVANREQVPKKVKINDQIFTLRQDCGGIYWYGRDYDHNTIEESQSANLEWTLNLDVEIIEEVEKPKKIEPLEFKYTNTYGNVSQHKASERDIIDTINEISKAVNYLLGRSEKE